MRQREDHMAEQVAGAVSGADCATVIGSDVVIKGEMTVEKGLRVDGQIEGAVTTKGKVILGRSGTLKAEVKAGTLHVEGKINGNVTVLERVQLEASSQIIGDLSAAKLIVAEGATLVGKVCVGPEAVKEAVRDTSGQVSRVSPIMNTGTAKASAAAAV